MSDRATLLAEVLAALPLAPGLDARIRAIAAAVCLLDDAPADGAALLAELLADVPDDDPIRARIEFAATLTRH